MGGEGGKVNDEIFTKSAGFFFGCLPLVDDATDDADFAYYSDLLQTQEAFSP